MEILKPENYERTEKIFASQGFHLAAKCVLSGQTRGRIYVDDADLPRAGLMRYGGHFLLAGDPTANGFCVDLHSLFTQEIYPKGRKTSDGGFVLFPEKGWEYVVDGIVLAGLEPVYFEREYYEYDLQEPPAVPELEEGFRYAEVTRALIEDDSLGHIADLREELLSERESTDEFLQKSFGVLILHGDEIVTWCLSEYNLGERCEVGIATNEAYRRRALAFKAGEAFLAKAYALGYRQIGWHCFKSNLPSSASARRIGFHLRQEYACYNGIYDPAENYAVHGDVHLRRGEYAESMRWLERAFTLDNAPAWAYFDAACASAQLGKTGPALDFLEQSIRRGFRNQRLLEQLDDLASLRDQPRWHSITGELEEADDHD